MSTSNTWEDGQLNLVFLNADFTGLGDAGGLLQSATAGSIEISLHTADPGEGGSQTTNEVAYTGYARSAKARNGTHWSVSGGVATNQTDIDFPLVGGAGPATVTHVGIGTAHSGAGKLLYSGALTTPKTLNNGDTIKILVGSLAITVT